MREIYFNSYDLERALKHMIRHLIMRQKLCNLLSVSFCEWNYNHIYLHKFEKNVLEFLRFSFNSKI